jgi:hypothetical protein
MPDLVPLHPRALIRHAVVRVLKDDERAAALLPGGVYPNRSEHWLAHELPASGVYTLQEQTLETDVYPDPRERRINLVVELLSYMSAGVDDALDALSLAVERALCLDSIGEAMGGIVNAQLVAAGKPPMEKGRRDGRILWPVDTLLTLNLTSTDIGIAADGDREIGVAVLTYALEYEAPRYRTELPDFLLAASGWDVEPADGRIDMVSRVEFAPAPAPAPNPAQNGIPEDQRDQMDDALEGKA